MKFATGFIVSILTASVYGLATAPAAREYADIEAFTVPLRRAFGAGQIDHFYRTNAAKFQHAAANLGYSDEGTTRYVPDQACGDPRHAVPLLRAFSPRLGNHLYTTDTAEFIRAVSNFGYTGEGTTGYLFSDQERHSIPLYRLLMVDQGITSTPPMRGKETGQLSS